MNTLMKPRYFSGTWDLIYLRVPGTWWEVSRVTRMGLLTDTMTMVELGTKLRKPNACTQLCLKNLFTDNTVIKISRTGEEQFKNWVSLDFKSTEWLLQHENVRWFDSQLIDGLCCLSQSIPRIKLQFMLMTPRVLYSEWSWIHRLMWTDSEIKPLFNGLLSIAWIRIGSLREIVSNVYWHVNYSPIREDWAPLSMRACAWIGSQSGNFK